MITRFVIFSEETFPCLSDKTREKLDKKDFVIT